MGCGGSRLEETNEVSGANGPLLVDFMAKQGIDVIGTKYNGGDNGVDNRQLNAVNEAIRSHPVEIVGKELRGYMTAMEKISTAEGVGIGQVNS